MPFSSSILPGQHETASARTWELGEACCDNLATASLRIDKGLNRLRQLGFLDRKVVVVALSGQERGKTTRMGTEPPATIGTNLAPVGAGSHGRQNAS